MTKLLKPAETAAQLGIAVETLCRWRKRGLGPNYTQAGKYVRYRQEDIDAFFEAEKQNGAA